MSIIIGRETSEQDSSQDHSGVAGKVITTAIITDAEISQQAITDAAIAQPASRSQQPNFMSQPAPQAIAAHLSAELIQAIDLEVAKFPPGRQQSALLRALMLAQTENNGWLTDSIIQAVAQYLQIPYINAYEVATFYGMYDLAPVGRYKICVCSSISCFLLGADDILTYLERKLGISCGQTTSDGKFTLKKVECLAACAGAPAVQIAGKYYENLTPERLDAILANCE